MITSLANALLGNRPARRIIDAGFVAYARRRMAQLDRMDVAKVQEHTLLRLVRRAQDTRFGRDHDFARIRSVADYQRIVPLREYEAMWHDYWKPTFPRLQGASWPDPVPYYALSSGTTSGATKYLPVTREMVRSNERGALSLIAAVLNAYPTRRLFQGRLFFLGGSTDLRSLDGAALAGDLSGIAAREAPRWLAPFRFPPPELALMTDWDQKVRTLAQHSATLPITFVSGIPAWLLVLFTRLKECTGKDRLIDIWPTLQVIVHGGTKFDPYRDMFRKEVGSPDVVFQEVYPCSEGFVAFEDPRHAQLLRVVPDHDIFFEFVPVDELGKDRPTRHTLATVEPQVQYAVIVTTCAGLWGYVLGDTVAFERREPPLLRFTGRTKYFLSAFGEHLISEEVEKAVAAAAAATGASVLDFHVGPVFPDDPRQLGHHLYLVEFADAPGDLSRFAAELDRELCRLNEDYAAHRGGGIGMDPPEVRPLARGAFSAWLRAQGKLGGQHKVPRMDNSGTLTRQIADWMAQHGLAPLPQPSAPAH